METNNTRALLLLDMLQAAQSMPPTEKPMDEGDKMLALLKAEGSIGSRRFEPIVKRDNLNDAEKKQARKKRKMAKASRKRNRR